MELDYDVVVVGFGPGGEMAASLLGQAGHRVLALDKAPAPYGLPRMSTLNGEIARMLQHAADPDRAMTDAIPVTTIKMFGAEGRELSPIHSPDKVGGHWSQYSLHQPNIEKAMEERIAECPSVDVRWGCMALDVGQHDDHVSVPLSDGTSVTARYLLGFDGSSSAVRAALGISLEILHEHTDQWILTDFDALRPLPDEPYETTVHMDPTGPWFHGPNGANRSRTDVFVRPTENARELLAEEHGYRFLEEKFSLTREDVRITRRVLYRFRSQIAAQFRAGRAFIGGDAAHAMVPGMGEGACCAMRDAANIAWKLDLVLSGRADPSLLDTYEAERKPQGTAYVAGSLMVWRSAVTTDPDKVAERDEMLSSVSTSAMRPPLEDGVIRRDSDGAPLDPAGSLAPQGAVDVDGEQVLLDNLVGYGAQLVTSIPVKEILGEERLRKLETLGVHVILVGSTTEADYPDSDDTYARFWEKHDAVAFLARPDTYLFGAATSASDVAALVEEFLSSVRAVGVPVH